MIPSNRDSRALPWLCTLRERTILGFAIAAPFSIAFMQAAQILTDLSWLATAKETRDGGPLRLPLLWPIAAFLAASLLSAAFGIDPGHSFYALKSSWLPAVFFFACVNTLTTATADRTARLLVVSGAVAAVVGLSQTLIRGTNFRIEGTFGHYMTFSGVILVISLLAAAQLIFNDQVRKIWAATAVVLLLAALLMTQTRSAWLGLAFGSVPLLWGWRKRYLLALPVVGIVVVLLSPQPVRDRVFSALDLEDVTLNERLYMWEGGRNIFVEYPLLGVGPDNLAQVYATYKHPDDPRLRFTHLHSNLMQTAAESGAITLLAWLAIWVAYFIAVARIYRRLDRDDGPAQALVVGSIAAIVAFLVAGVFECNYRDTEVAAVVYFVLALPFCAQPPASDAFAE